LTENERLIGQDVAVEQQLERNRVEMAASRKADGSDNDKPRVGERA